MPAEAVLTTRFGGARLMAAASLCAGVGIFSVQDVILKYVSGSYPLHEAVAIRCAVALPILLYMVHRRGGLRRIVSRRSGALALRGGLLILAYGSYYLAFPVMKLAAVVTLYFTTPLFITALAQPLLGEKVSLKAWLAVLVGFVGVVVTYRPGVGLFDWASLLPVAAAFTYALAALMARRLGTSESASLMGFYQNLTFLVAALVLAVFLGDGRYASPDMHKSLAFLLRPWSFENPTDLLLLAACGPVAAFGAVLLTHAYRTAEVNFVAPFEYSGLVWAASWGFFVFHEVPGPYLIVGAALITGSGLYMLLWGRRAQT